MADPKEMFKKFIKCLKTKIFACASAAALAQLVMSQMNIFDKYEKKYFDVYLIILASDNID